MPKSKTTSEEKSLRPIRQLRNLFITGLLVLMPLFATGFIVFKVFDLTDRWLREPLKPWFDDFCQTFFNTTYNIPPYGIGFVVTILAILLSGMLAKNIIGRRLFAIMENVMYRLPLISRIFLAIKQMSEHILQRDKNVFQGVVLVEYPRRGLYSVGFVMNTETGPITNVLGEKCVSIFISTTPNPTSGLYVIVPVKDVILLDISVEEAMKLVISAGVVVPGMTPAPPALRAELEALKKESSSPSLESSPSTPARPH